MPQNSKRTRTKYIYGKPTQISRDSEANCCEIKHEIYMEMKYYIFYGFERSRFIIQQYSFQ